MAWLKAGRAPPTKGKGSKISEKMLLFVEAYLADPELNASKAIITAGYKTKNPNRLATELLNHPLVSAEIRKKLDARSERLELSADYVITELMVIVEKTKEGNPQAALRGLELLGKHLGLYRDKQEISGPDGGAIEYEQKVKEDAADFTRRIAQLSERGGTGTVVKFPDGTAKS